MLCQTGLPYRNQNELRRWERNNGRVSLEIEAGRALDPKKNEYIDVPLPFGTKARLVLIHLNSQAVKTGSPVIEVENSLTAFVKSLLKRSPNGREIRDFKNPNQRVLWPSTVRLSQKYFGHTRKTRYSPGRTRRSRLVTLCYGTGRLCMAGTTPAPHKFWQASFCAMGVLV